MTLALNEASVIRNRRSILDAASTRCSPGEFTALCGPNGAGKTTALSVMSGALQADKGGSTLEDRNIRAFRANNLARRRAVVSQNSLLNFPFEVHEVVTMGRAPHHGRSTPARDREIVGHVIELLDLAALAERNFMTLSGGERQRVHIARALAQVWEPPEDDGSRWLLLDEPTSALDLKYQIALMRLLENLAADGWGVVAVLHDLHLVKRHADHIVLFKEGRIVADGPVSDHLTSARVQDVFDLDAPYALH